MGWQEWLAERPIAVLATTSADGTPHAVPVEVVVDADLVYAWCESWSVKIRNIARTGTAAMVAYRGHAFVLVRGRARLLGDGDASYGRVTDMFLKKYDREESYGNDTLIEIAPDRVSAWEK
jgi:nitroimidazol reductase NimA-like FMN-containing flavoprotein (pyridoxamine 5'-phosphate oxidase superfamily)